MPHNFRSLRNREISVPKKACTWQDTILYRSHVYRGIKTTPAKAPQSYFRSSNFKTAKYVLIGSASHRALRSTDLADDQSRFGTRFASPPLSSRPSLSFYSPLRPFSPFAPSIPYPSSALYVSASTSTRKLGIRPAP